jgi:hypothetical protein
LTAPVSTTRSTNKTSDKLTFPTSLLLHPQHLHKHNQAGRKGKPRHSDGGLEVEVEVNGVQELELARPRTCLEKN